MEDGVAVEDAAVDPQGDRLELRPDALAGERSFGDTRGARAEDVPALVADVVLAGNGQEGVRGDLGIIGRFEGPLVEIMPGQIAPRDAQVTAVESPVEPPGRARRRPERGRL